MKYPILIFFVAVLLILAMWLSMSVGSVNLDPGNLIRSLISSSHQKDDPVRTILIRLRLPRVVLSALAGCALGLSGAAFQGIFRNPLADPYIIGASSGASLGATIATVYGFSLGASASLSAAAFTGSILTVALVFVFARGNEHNPPVVSLLLAGIAVSSFISSLVTFILFLHSEDLYTVFFWLLGSFTSSDYSDVMVLFITTLFGFGFLLLLSYSLDLLSFGDESAASSGVPVGLVRTMTIITATVITASAVSVCGVIAFAGLIAPHISRLFIGPRHSRLFLLSSLVGGLLLVASDIIARTLLYPRELPVGIITSLLGAPFFLYLLYARNGAEQR
ncbi:MAG: iron ABC transporter permease [Spirochaetales bacterium]|nr:iron ABC transporter permease [Spirochaetales bacterium]